MSDILAAGRGRRRARAGDSARGGKHVKWKPRKQQGSTYRPSNPKKAPSPKIMKGLGFKPAHPVEGKAYLPQGKGPSAIKQFATRHAGKLAKAMSGARLGMGALGGAGVAASAFAVGHDVAVAAREGMKALKLHSEAKMDAKAQKRKYGTIEAATRTRHARQKTSN